MKAIETQERKESDKNLKEPSKMQHLARGTSLGCEQLVGFQKIRDIKHEERKP